MAAVGEVRRFRTSRELAAYLGLDPKVRQSGSEPVRSGPISKQGSAAEPALYTPVDAELPAPYDSACSMLRSPPAAAAPKARRLGACLSVVLLASVCIRAAPARAALGALPDRYIGTISGSDHRVVPGFQDITGKWSGNVTFASTAADPNFFPSVSGTATWSESGTETVGSQTCQISIGPATAPVGLATAAKTVSGSVQLFPVPTLQYQAALTTNAQLATGTETCPTGSLPAYYELPNPLQTRPRETANPDQSLSGTYQITAGFDTVTDQWHLTPAGGLHADPGGPYTVSRGGRLRLDGSRSTPKNKITSYRWSFNQPSATSPPGRRPNAGRKTGVRPSVVMLCSMRLTLTVSDGHHQDNASVAIRVRPRHWTTPVRQVRYSVGGGGITWSGPDDTGGFTAGINESACPHATAATPTVVCPLFGLHNTWNDHGYTLARVHDPGGPFDRWWYPGSSTLTMVTQKTHASGSRNSLGQARSS